jgi:hypothetical protein
MKGGAARACNRALGMEQVRSSALEGDFSDRYRFEKRHVRRWLQMVLYVLCASPMK